jgi:hypothetical protein
LRGERPQEKKIRADVLDGVYILPSLSVY